MLYRTLHPSFPLFQFHHFLCATTPTSLPHPLLSSSSKVGTEMECVKAALKTSFRSDFVETRTFLDESPAVDNGASCDDFSVDELLDLSNVTGFEEDEQEQRDIVEEEEEQGQDHKGNPVLGPCGKDDLGVTSAAAELTFPTDDAANLEWLSHFVEDSFSGFSTPFPDGMLPEKPRVEQDTTGSEKLSFKNLVPAKARTKRGRAGGHIWSLGSPSLSETSATSSSSSSSTSTITSCSPTPWFICTKTGLIEPVYLEAELSVKKPKRKPPAPATAPGNPARRCSHCGVQKTPQWRAGPLGAKTLCNACGVRFKSGRLLPEYRPACSPTFSCEVHSNHHRKVLEMRRKKDTAVGQQEAPMAMSGF